MVTLDDVARIASERPKSASGYATATERGSSRTRASCGSVPSARPTSKRFGDVRPPDGPIVAARVEELGEKEAVLAANPKAFFTIPHFDGYPAVLIRLKKVTKRAVRDAIVDAWLACAPSRLAQQYIEAHGPLR